jgi:flagellar biosynthesis protein FlhA
VQLAPEWDEIFARHQIDGGAAGLDVALPPTDFARLGAGLAEAFGRLSDEGTRAALVTTARRRRFLRTIMAARDVSAPVLSFEEIGLDARLALVAQVPG